jgi:hypothetical protein
MNLKGREMMRSWPNLNYYPGISLEVLGKGTRTSIRIAGLQAEI